MNFRGRPLSTTSKPRLRNIERSVLYGFARTACREPRGRNRPSRSRCIRRRPRGSTRRSRLSEHAMWHGHLDLYVTPTVDRPVHPVSVPNADGAKRGITYTSGDMFAVTAHCQYAPRTGTCCRYFSISCATRSPIPTSNETVTSRRALSLSSSMSARTASTMRSGSSPTSSCIPAST
jgi:hypothetical protein